ncbi:MAG TPA: peptide deformylase [Candidatus Saccharimonadales bacterium]|nr:peptide deformylase [Candidatus Saccharimonadales bacterium]
MPAKKNTHGLPLPIDRYELTTEDRLRFAEEAALGMVVPQASVLTQRAKEVHPDAISSEQVQAVIRRLLSTGLAQRQGREKNKKRRTLVGLAAPQIGESLRIIVIDIKIGPDRKRPGKLDCFINPEIIWSSRETVEGPEGCFSAGLVWGLVRRPVAVKIRAYTPEGKQIERIFEGFTARIAQHEYDHLDGIRFADRIKSDRKRHWVHTEELPEYPKHSKHWPRLCTRQQWELFKRPAKNRSGAD